MDERQLEAVISDDARRAAAAGGSDGPGPLERALGDGEDFELLLAAAGDVSDVPVTVYPVGEVTSADLRLRHTDGRIDPLEPRGFVH